MDLTKSPFAHLERLPPSTGFAAISCSVLIFACVNRLVNFIGPPQTIEKKDIWKYRNLFISWIHAVIVGVWDLSCYFMNPEMFLDLLVHYTYSSYAMVAFSTGYFIYDFLEIIMAKGVWSNWEIIAHHIVIVSIFGCNVICCQYIAFNVIALLAEVNSVFLHLRKLMQMRKVDYNSLPYRINVYMNIATLILGRFGGLIAIFYGIYIWHDRAHILYTVSLTVTCILLSVLNAVLLYRLLKNDILRTKSYKEQVKSDKHHMNGEIDHLVNNNLTKKID